MVAAPEYSVKTQAKLVSALCVLHNFTCVYDPDPDDDVDFTAEVACGAPQASAEDLGSFISRQERNWATEMQDEIAKRMWDDYVDYTTRN